MVDEVGRTMKHFLTIYGEEGKVYAESWLQINLIGKWCFCFSRRKIEIIDKELDFLRKRSEKKDDTERVHP